MEVTDVDGVIVPPETPQMDPPEIPAAGPPEVKAKRRWRRRIGYSSLVLLVGGIIAVFTVHLDYFAFSPGGATPSQNLVVVGAGVQSYPAKGQVRYTTVLVTSDRVNLYQWAEAKLDSDIDLVESKYVLGTRSKAETDKEDQQSMVESQNTAALVAMQRVGFIGQGVEILDFVKDAPSAKFLQVSDVITAIDGAPVQYFTDLFPLISKHTAGGDITVTVNRKGTSMTQTFPMFKVDNGNGTKRFIIGISAQGTFKEKVGVKLQNVGGPSAGLAFTLSVIDVLTPGELTGGNSVATTGTIEKDGSVGEIGGIKQKTIAVKESGAVMFIVPAAEAAEAQKYAGSKLKIVGVKNLEEALAALGTIGGNVNDLPKATPSGV